MKTFLFERVMSTGKTLRAYREGWQMIAEIDGVLAGGGAPGVLGKNRLAEAQRFNPDYTHALSGRRGDLILLTRQEMAIWEQSAAPRDPVVVQRQALRTAIDLLVDEQARMFDGMHAQGDARAWATRSDYDARIRAAEDALRAFNAEHPPEPQVRAYPAGEGRDF